MNDAQLDLSRLALDRSASAGHEATRQARKRKWLARYVVPLAILMGFVVLILAAAGNSLWHRPSVEVVPVIAKRSQIRQAGTPLFQAAGWIEPRPTPINVPALTPGVIEELLVVEGQAVKKGESIAKLISIDAEIAVKQAQVALATSEGELQRAQAEERAAEIRLAKPVHLEVELAAAKGVRAKAETELASLPFQIETAKANLEYAQQSVAGKEAAGNAVASVVLQKAKSELAAADSRLRELQKREPRLRDEIAAIDAQVKALATKMELLIEENRQLGEARARVQSATALRDAAKLELEKAELDLERNVIRAPIDGRILRLINGPGMRVMGMDRSAGHNSSSVVEMYDPDRLQVRADVRLQDVPNVQSGQLVTIETASSEAVIQGRVLQANSSANIQKNTLEVKVEIIDPPPTVRPEMLVTTTFLAPEKIGASVSEPAERECLFVPKRLVQSGEKGDFIWLVDAEGRARQASIQRGESVSEALIEITSGLKVTDKLIASDTRQLRDGQAVFIAGEDTSLGR